jgi:hypothetical protein
MVINVFSCLKSEGILTREKKIRIIVTSCLAALIALSMLYSAFLNKEKIGAAITKTVGFENSAKPVSLPSIVNGSLVLPQDKDQFNFAVNQLTKDPEKNSLAVLSANLVGVFDPVSQNQKLTGIRVVGETKNIGNKKVTAFQPVVRYIDADDKVKTQKVGRYNEGYQFPGLDPGEVTFYDVIVDTTVDELTEKVEVVFGADSKANNAYIPLKIEGRNFEVKIASNSATGETAEYYSATGDVVNTFDDYVTDITVVVWVKDKDNQIFSINRQQFKNDLIAPGNRISFKVPLLPLKMGKYESYELEAFGKEFKLKL